MNSLWEAAHRPDLDLFRPLERVSENRAPLTRSTSEATAESSSENSPHTLTIHTWIYPREPLNTKSQAFSKDPRREFSAFLKHSFVLMTSPLTYFNDAHRLTPLFQHLREIAEIYPPHEVVSFLENLSLQSTRLQSEYLMPLIVLTQFIDERTPTAGSPDKGSSRVLGLNVNRFENHAERQKLIQYLQNFFKFFFFQNVPQALLQLLLRVHQETLDMRWTLVILSEYFTRYASSFLNECNHILSLHRFFMQLSYAHTHEREKHTSWLDPFTSKKTIDSISFFPYSPISKAAL